MTYTWTILLDSIKYAEHFCARRICFTIVRPFQSCEKEHVFHLVSSIVTDYCVLQTGGSNDLKACLEICPRFCCVFMVAVTTFYTL